MFYLCVNCATRATFPSGADQCKVSVQNRAQMYPNISHLTELLQHVLEDVGGCVIQEGLEGWEVDALLEDVLDGFFTLTKCEQNVSGSMEAPQELIHHVSKSWNLKIKCISQSILQLSCFKNSCQENSFHFGLVITRSPASCLGVKP